MTVASFITLNEVTVGLRWTRLVGSTGMSGRLQASISLPSRYVTKPTIGQLSLPFLRGR